MRLEKYIIFFSTFMKQFNTNKKLVKLKYLLENSKINTVSNCSEIENSFQTADMSKNVSLFLSLIEKPINLLFSIDQFVFEFSKKTYQQRKTGEFFHQLKERKKLSLFYGHLTRKQIFNLFNKAKKNKGYFSKNIFCLLERRLDVVLYRSGLTKTIAESRQLIKHKKILVNEKIVNMPSFSLNPGDFIEMTPKTGEILSNSLKLKTKAMKTHPKSVSDSYSKFKKTLDSSLNLEKSKRSLKNQASKAFHSQILCKLFIQLVCTKIKSRSFWALKKQGAKPFSNFQNIETKKLFFFKSTKDLNTSTISSKKYSNQGKNQNSFLTLLKWKCFSKKRLAFFRKYEKSIAPKLGLKRKNLNQQSLYANQGCLQKKPAFWNRNVSSLEKKKIGKQRNSQTYKNYLKLLSFRKDHGTVYRKSFLIFLKHLENSQRFQSLLTLNMNRFFFKKSFYKQKYKVSSFSKNLTFRLIRPMNLEISYNLLSLVYLYSPQRVNFPFYIDLDLIQRSLR